MLCEICIRIDFFAILQRELKATSVVSRRQGSTLYWFEPNEDTLVDIQDPLTPWHKTYASLRESADACDLCRVVLPVVTESTKIIKKDDCITTWLSGLEYYLSGPWGTGGRDINIIGRDMAEEEAEKTPKYWLMGGIGFRVDDSSPLKDVIPGRTIDVSPKSDMSLRRVRSWLRHETDYDQTPPSRLPTRVLKLQDDASKVTVCPGDGELGNYAALSHCWGSSQPLTLNSATFDELHQGVLVNKLPQSFQDAIWVAHQLGIPYLWIDSLCIVQDDPGDWARESSKMSEVYGNAHLTIAAARAKDSYAGFLGPREMPGAMLSLRTDSVSGEAFALPLSRDFVKQSVSQAGMGDEPLSNRAWALQERYLSAQTLHFTRTQIYFDPGWCSCSEDARVLQYRPIPRFARETQPPRKGPMGEDSESHAPWLDTVSSYSKRKLTKATDKLPALAGLAARFALFSSYEDDALNAKNRYLAGLWEEYLFLGMCWAVKSYDPGPRPSDVYRAPTWSWASVDEEVEFVRDMFSQCQALAVLKDAHVDLKTPTNIFGQITGGWLHIQVMRFRAYVTEPGSHDCRVVVNEDEDEVLSVVPRWDGKRYRTSVFEQQPDASKGEVELFAVPVAASECPFPIPFFVFLVPVDRKPSGINVADMLVFQRVGASFPYSLKGTPADSFVRVCVAAKEEGRLEDVIIV